MIELLAPAGDLEKLKFALHYGADAVYVGGQNFSLRANAKNFSLQDLEEALLFAHERGKKVYVTVNIVFHDEDIKGLKIAVPNYFMSDIVNDEIKQKVKKIVSILEENGAIWKTQAGIFALKEEYYDENIGIYFDIQKNDFCFI